MKPKFLFDLNLVLQHEFFESSLVHDVVEALMDFSDTCKWLNEDNTPSTTVKCNLRLFHDQSKQFTYSHARKPLLDYIKDNTAII